MSTMQQYTCWMIGWWRLIYGLVRDIDWQVSNGGDEKLRREEEVGWANMDVGIGRCDGSVGWWWEEVVRVVVRDGMLKCSKYHRLRVKVPLPCSAMISFGCWEVVVDPISLCSMGSPSETTNPTWGWIEGWYSYEIKDLTVMGVGLG